MLEKIKKSFKWLKINGSNTFSYFFTELLYAPVDRKQACSPTSKVMKQPVYSGN